MDEIIRKAYDSDNGNRTTNPVVSQKKKRGRPRGRHHKTIVREHVINDCKALVERQALKVTKAILEEEAKIAFSDIRQLFTEEGELIPPHELPDNVAAAIQSVKITERTIPRKNDEPITLVTYDIKFWDKSSALERMSKHFGLYKADNQQKPVTQVNLQQININLSDFTEEELNLLVKLGGNLDGNIVELPQLEVLDVDEY